MSAERVAVRGALVALAHTWQKRADKMLSVPAFASPSERWAAKLASDQWAQLAEDAQAVAASFIDLP